jgi:leucine dehydrogenase
MEYLGGYNREIVFQQTEKIYDTCIQILKKSEMENIPAQQAAIETAKARIESMGRVKLPY